MDLVGFTPLAEKRDPEEIRELLSIYFERAQSIVGHYGGTIEKFIGDAVMAVWGAPVANEDDAERSVRAALDLVAAVVELGTRSNIELQARAGVVTGEVAITVGKVAEGMVLGDTVNAASRLQSAAPPGSVLVDEATWRSASDAIAFSEVGQIVVKGRQEPISAWRALRVVAQRKGAGRRERLEPPFVGRDEELGLVKELLHATSREGKARLVSITGIPGVGKSRLAWEFSKYVDGLADPVYWHEGMSPAYGEGVTFWALADMVRMRARVTDTDDAETERSKLSACLAELVEDAELRRWMEPRLSHLLGLAETPPGGPEELFSAWRTFFERVAALGPTVMVFEDLQWADPGLIDFIESILEWSKNRPILVVTLSRPELMDRRPNWGAGVRNATSLRLEPLAEDEMLELLSGFVRGLPEPIVARILERSEGVPLYAVETVRMLVDRGLIIEREGGYDVAAKLESLDVPETLQALVASRLDGLPPRQRSLLQDAAVLGHDFSLDSLTAVVGSDAEALEPDLRDLVRKEFLTRDNDVRSPERGRYRFVQGLIAEVASATLSRRDRAAKHVAVARHLESLGDEELAPAVAANFLAAYRAIPEAENAAELVASAREWLVRSAQRALSLGSPEQANDLLGEALEVTPQGALRPEILELAGEAARMANQSERCVALYDEALSYFRSIGDLSGVGRATAKQARTLSFGLGRYSDAIDRCEAAFQALGDSGDDQVRCELASTVARTASLTGQYNKSLEWSETALVLAEGCDDPELMIHGILGRANALFNLGRHREAVILARGAISLAQSAGLLQTHVVGLVHLSVFVMDDDPREAMAACNEAIGVARRAGERADEVLNMLNACELAVFLGDWDQARALLADLAERELLPMQAAWRDWISTAMKALLGEGGGASADLSEAGERAASTEFVAERTTYLKLCALTCLAAGKLEEAHGYASEAVAAEALGINSPAALALQGRAALWRNDAASARRVLESMSGFRGRWMATCRLSLEAGLAALEGEADKAVTHYRRAIEAWRALDCTLDLAMCELDLVSLLGPQHPESSVAKEARDIFVQIGAVPFLERLKAVTAQGLDD